MLMMSITMSWLVMALTYQATCWGVTLEAVPHPQRRAERAAIARNNLTFMTLGIFKNKPEFLEDKQI